MPLSYHLYFLSHSTDRLKPIQLQETSSRLLWHAVNHHGRNIGVDA